MGKEKHLQFIVSIYCKQLVRGCHFLHEHPATTLSWAEPEIVALAKHPMIHCVVADQCQYPDDRHGDSIKKPTGFMSNSSELLKALRKQCFGKVVSARDLPEEDMQSV